jgi:hypothetical protein
MMPPHNKVLVGAGLPSRREFILKEMKEDKLTKVLVSRGIRN